MTRSILARVLAGIVAMGAAGCIPLGTAGSIDQATANQLRQEVPVYDSSMANGLSYKELGKVSAWSCDNTLFAGGGDQDQVVAKLRQQAKSAGGNALLDLSCNKSGIGSGCIASLSCSAKAINVSIRTKLN